MQSGRGTCGQTDVWLGTCQIHPDGISCQLGAGSLQCSLASKGTVSRVLFLGPGLRPPVAFFWDSS